MRWALQRCLVVALLVGGAFAGLHNFQQQFPFNLYLGDYTGDGVDEWLTFGRKHMFLARADFLSIGLLAHELPNEPRSVFYGRLRVLQQINGNRDDVCAVMSDNRLSCFRVADDLKVAVWLTAEQSPFASTNLIVVDLKGDGIQDVIDCKAGAVFAVDAGQQQFVKQAIDIAEDIKQLLATLGSDAASLIQIRTIRLEGGQADSLLLFNMKDGNAVKLALVSKDGKSVLQRDGAPINVPVTTNDRVSIARVRGVAFDDVVLYTPSTGAYRFCNFITGNTAFACIAEAATDPDLSGATGNLELYWARLSLRKGADAQRHDSLLYNSATKLFYVAVAGDGDAAPPNAPGAVPGAAQNLRLPGASGNAAPAQAGSFIWAFTQRALQLEEDQDGDGLKTIVELGVLKDVPLHTYGSSPFTQDIFVEVDYMTGAVGKGQAEYKMSDAAISIAVSSMAQKGINLHIVQDQGVPFKECINQKAAGLDWVKDFDEPFKDKYFTPARKGIFRYCLWAYQYDCPGQSSGIARAIGSSDFMVTLGSWERQNQYKDNQMAGTFLHELGHTLGLRHGGSDDQSYKPNHISIMNYLFQTRGIKKDGKDQFLYGELPCDDLKLTEADETKGIKCTGVNDAVYQTYFKRFDRWLNLNTASDMNGDSKIESKAVANVDSRLAGIDLLKGGVEEYSKVTIPAGDIAAGLNAQGAPVPAAVPTRPSSGPRPSTPNNVVRTTGRRSRFRAVHRRLKRAHSAAEMQNVVKKEPELDVKDLLEMSPTLRKFTNFIPNWRSLPAGKSKLQVVPPTLVSRVASRESKIRFNPTIQKRPEAASIAKFNVPVFAAKGFNNQGRLSEDARNSVERKFMIRLVKVSLPPMAPANDNATPPPGSSRRSRAANS